MSERHIYAAYDDAGIHVYQAFTPSIVQAALAKGTFGQAIHEAVRNQRPLPDVPEERLYPLDAELAQRLGVLKGSSAESTP